ncbi:MAG: hypothetical protein ORN98_09735 [Alphaproteobacteria bacterium]|nr:hypothetical protein [Alphaproteobacteria bacterium]
MTTLFVSRFFWFVMMLVMASSIIPNSGLTTVSAKAAETEIPLAEQATFSPPAPPVLGQPITLPPGQTINDYKHPFMVGGMVGTLGTGAEFQYGLPNFGWGFNHFAVRGGFNYLNFSMNQSLGTGNPLTIGFKLVTPELLFDLYPSSRSGFHFTIGAMYPIGGIDARFKTRGIKLFDTQFVTVEANMKIAVSSIPIVPYFGVGIKSWTGARANSENWIGSNVDLGFLMITPKATGGIGCGNCEYTFDVAGNKFTIIDIQNQFNESVIDKANAAVSTIPIYPVLRWTVSIIF